MQEVTTRKGVAERQLPDRQRGTAPQISIGQGGKGICRQAWD
jgi:hypothetical protein